MHQVLVEAATIKSIYATNLNIFVFGEIKETFRFCSFFCRTQRAFNPALPPSTHLLHYFYFQSQHLLQFLRSSRFIILFYFLSRR